MMEPIYDVKSPGALSRGALSRIRRRELWLDAEARFPREEKLVDADLPPCSCSRPKVVEGSALYILSEFCPLDELPVGELAYIYLLEDKEERLAAFKCLVKRFLENANPWVDYPNDESLGLESKKSSERESVHGEAGELETRFARHFEDLERRILPRRPQWPRWRNPPRYTRLLKESIKSVRSQRNRRRDRSEDQGDTMCLRLVGRDKRSQHPKIGERERVQLVEVFSSPSEDYLSPDSKKNRKIIPENFDVFKTLHMAELMNIFGNARSDERWILFRNAIRRAMEEQPTKPKAVDSEETFTSEVRAIYDRLDKQINVFIRRMDQECLSSDGEGRRAQRAALAGLERASEKVPKARIHAFDNTRKVFPTLASKEARPLQTVTPTLCATKITKACNLPALDPVSCKERVIEKHLLLWRQKFAGSFPPIIKSEYNRSHVYLHAKPLSL